MTEEYKRKLENERSLHVQECAELRKEQKQIQSKENQRRVSMAKNYRAELKVSSYSQFYIIMHVCHYIMHF